MPAVAPVAPVAPIAPVELADWPVAEFFQVAPSADARPAVAQSFGTYTGPAAYRPFGDDPRTRELARKLAGATDDEARDKLRGELKAALAKAFDDRLKGQEKQIEELDRQLKALKEQVGRRREAKAGIVADRLAALEKQAKGLGW